MSYLAPRNQEEFDDMLSAILEDHPMFKHPKTPLTINELLFLLQQTGLAWNVNEHPADKSWWSCIQSLDAFVPTSDRAHRVKKMEFDTEEYGGVIYLCLDVEVEG